MKKTNIKTFLIILLFSLPLFAQEPKLAIMPFVDSTNKEKLSNEMLESEANWMRTQFIKKSKNRFRVISTAEQEKAIKQQKKESYRADRDKSGQISLGKAISAQKIIYTVIRSFGSKYTVNSELIDLETESTDDAASEDFDGSPESFRKALFNIVDQLSGEAEKKELADAIEKKRISKQQLSSDERACEYSLSESSIVIWESYLEDFPEGKCAFEAKINIKKLKKKAEEERMAAREAELRAAEREREFAERERAEREAAEKARKCSQIEDLQWSDLSSGTMTWQQANAYCSKGGFRLPDVWELKALSECSNNLPHGIVWTSSSSSSQAAFFNFNNNFSTLNNKFERYRVLCVR